MSDLVGASADNELSAKRPPRSAHATGSECSGRTGQESDRGVGAIKSIDKAMGILRELYTASRPMRVSELAKSLSLSPSVVSRIVSTLARGGLVDHDEETNRISARAWPGTAGPRRTWP